MGINCENRFCIYWKKNKCALRRATLDIMGCCQECVYVEIDERVLNRVRQKILKSQKKK
jgi:hypothetical protein